MVDSITKIVFILPVKKAFVKYFLNSSICIFNYLFSVDALTASIIPLLALSKLYSFTSFKAIV